MEKARKHQINTENYGFYNCKLLNFRQSKDEVTNLYAKNWK